LNETDGETPSFDIVFPEDGMVIPTFLRPTLWNSPSWTQDFLCDKNPDLDPYPSSIDTKSFPIRVYEQDIVFAEVEVSEWEETKNGLTDDEAPEEGFAAVSDDVAADLGDPEGQVGE
jgi:hypothetical protein